MSIWRQLTHGLRLTGQRTAAAAPVRGDQTQQEDDRLAGDQQQEDHGEEQGGADRERPVPDHRQRRQDDEDDQDHELEPEAAETRAQFRGEVVAAVLDGARRARAARRRRVGVRVRHRCRRVRWLVVGLGRVGGRVGHEAQRYGSRPLGACEPASRGGRSTRAHHPRRVLRRHGRTRTSRRRAAIRRSPARYGLLPADP